MKEYSFLELSNFAQIKAVYLYTLGWRETHPDDDLTFNEIADILIDNTQDAYDKNGNLLVDNW